MGYREDDRNPRRHVHRLGRAHRHGRRRRAARRRLSSGRRRALSRHHELRPLRQVAALRGPLRRPVAQHVRGAPGRAGGLDQPIRQLGGGRSGEMGAGRLRHRARRLARRRPFARHVGHLVAARGQGLPRLHRMGRRAAVVERQGRTQRHLLLRHEPVADGGAAAAASRRHLRLGGRRRLLPRPHLPRRHLLSVAPPLVSLAGAARAARPRRQRPAQQHDRRMGVGPGDLDRRGTRQLAPRLGGGGLPQQARHRQILDRAHAGLVEGHGAAVVGGELGRPGPASARQFRRFRARRVRK